MPTTLLLSPQDLKTYLHFCNICLSTHFLFLIIIPMLVFAISPQHPRFWIQGRRTLGGPTSNKGSALPFCWKNTSQTNFWLPWPKNVYHISWNTYLLIIAQPIKSFAPFLQYYYNFIYLLVNHEEVFRKYIWFNVQIKIAIQSSK